MNSTIEILAFGQIIDITNQKSWHMDMMADTDQLIAYLVKSFPQLAHSKYLLAVNMEIIRGNVELHPGDIVALLPPFSGG